MDVTAKPDEAEAEECPNCGEDITEDNPAKEWDGESRCSACLPHCEKCGEEVEPDDGHGTCENCDSLFCEQHIYYCQCCEVSVCESCRDNHGT